MTNRTPELDELAYQGTLPLELQVCAWCAARYGTDHRSDCVLVTSYRAGELYGRDVRDASELLEQRLRDLPWPPK